MALALVSCRCEMHLLPGSSVLVLTHLHFCRSRTSLWWPGGEKSSEGQVKSPRTSLLTSYLRHQFKSDIHQVWDKFQGSAGASLERSVRAPGWDRGPARNLRAGLGFAPGRQPGHPAGSGSGSGAVQGQRPALRREVSWPGRVGWGEQGPGGCYGDSCYGAAGLQGPGLPPALGGRQRLPVGPGRGGAAAGVPGCPRGVNRLGR